MSGLVRSAGGQVQSEEGLASGGDGGNGGYSYLTGSGQRWAFWWYFRGNTEITDVAANNFQKLFSHFDQRQ